MCNDIPVKKLQVFQGQLHLWIYTIWTHTKGIPDTSMHHWWEFNFLMRFIFVSYFLIYDNFNIKALSTLLSVAVEPLSSLKKWIGSLDFNVANWHWCSKCCKLLYYFKAENAIYSSRWCLREHKVWQFKREADVRSSQIPVTSRVGAICLFHGISTWLSLTYFPLSS